MWDNLRDNLTNKNPNEQKTTFTINIPRILHEFIIKKTNEGHFRSLPEAYRKIVGDYIKKYDEIFNYTNRRTE